MGKKAVLFLMIFLSLIGISYADEEDLIKSEILEIEEYSSEGIPKTKVKARILEGEYKGKVVNIEYIPIEYSSNNYKLVKGTKILIKLDFHESGGVKARIINISREDHLKILGMIFLASVILFGGIKGILSVASLGITGIIIVKIMIPMILDGHSPMLVAVVSTVIIILISFVLISGFTRKSLVAILGTVGGTITAGILAKIFTDLCAITGFGSEEVNVLIRHMDVVIDYRGLYLSGVLIGAIGVVMDVSMSITSMIFELKAKNPNIGFGGLVESGLKVGRDIMATMVNTLVLAYVGGAMPVILVLYFMKLPFNSLVSTDILTTEIIRSLCGSVGLILTIPFTSIIAGILVPDKKHVRKKYKYRR